MQAPMSRVLQEVVLSNLVDPRVRSRSPPQPHSLLECSSSSRGLLRILQCPVDVFLDPHPLPLPLQILQGAVRDGMRISLPSSLKLLLRQLQMRLTGSHRDGALGVTPTRLSLLNKPVHFLQQLPQRRGDVFSRAMATADPACPRDLQFRSHCKPSRLQPLVNRILSPRTLRTLPESLRGDFSRLLVPRVFLEGAQMFQHLQLPSASTCAPTPLLATSRLPLQLTDCSRVFEKDSAHTGFEPLPRR